MTVRALPIPRLPRPPQAAADSIGIGDDLVIAGAHALEGEINRGGLAVQCGRIGPRQDVRDRMDAAGRWIEYPVSRAKDERDESRRGLLV